MFFAIARELGYDAVKIKELAKKKFNKEHFNELDTAEMNYLIERLVKIQHDKEAAGQF